MRNRWAFHGVFLVALALGGCGGSKMMDEMESHNSMVFGYIDMSDSPASELAAFSLRQVAPKTDKPYWNMRVHEGVFYLENVTPGSYQLNQFGGPGGFFSSASFYWFNFPRQSEGFRIRKPGIYYLGAFKYKKAGSFWNPKFDIEPVKSPSEREVIEKILEFSKDTKWEGQLRSRASVLARSK